MNAKNPTNSRDRIGEFDFFTKLKIDQTEKTNPKATRVTFQPRRMLKVAKFKKP